MLRPRILFIGDPAAVAPYRGIAKKWARATFLERVRNKTYRFADVEIRVENRFEINESKVYIKANPLKFMYQFFGTLDFMYQDYVDIDHYGPFRPLPRGYMTFVTAKPDPDHADKLILTAKPILSNVEYLNDDNGNPLWIADTSPLPEVVNRAARIKPCHQPDGFGVHQHWVSATTGHPSNPWIMSQWAAARPCHNLHRQSGSDAGRNSYVDIGYDYSSVLFRGNKGRDSAPDADFYQRAALLKVKSDSFGTRQFIVMVDAAHVFYCYPTSAREADYLDIGSYAGIKTNVPDSKARSAPCPWPSWANFEAWGRAAGTEPDPPLVERPQPIWRFSPDGQRAACITAHRDDSWADARYESTYLLPYPLTGQERWKVREDYPGLVEVVFSVSLTGPDAEDFSFSASLGRTLYSKIDGKIPLDVGYAVRDMPLDVDVPDVRAGDLLALFYKHYMSHSTFSQTPDPVDINFPDRKELIRPNFATKATVERFDNGDWIELKHWCAWMSCCGAVGGPYLAAYEGRDFSPHLESLVNDFNPSIETVDLNDFSFLTNVVSLDLPTLSWALGATIRTAGRIPERPQSFNADAAVLVVSTFGEEHERRTAGHPSLIDSAAQLFDMTGAYPDWDAMTPIDINATATYHFPDDPPGSPGYYQDDQTSVAVLEVVNGATSSVEIGNAGARVVGPSTNLSTDPFAQSGKFPSLAELWLPTLYELFDVAPLLRPGIVWFETGPSYVGPGRLEMTGFPFGAVHNAKVSAATLSGLNALHQKVRSCIDGSWACYVGPVAAYNGVRIVGQSPSLANYQQIEIDKISFRVENTDGTLRRMGEYSHLEAINSAFRKNLTYTDLHFDLRLNGTVVEVKPKGKYPSYTQWFSFLPNSTFLGPLSAGFVSPYLYQGYEIVDHSLGASLDYYQPSDSNHFFSALCHPNPAMEAVFGLGKG